MVQERPVFQRCATLVQWFCQWLLFRDKPSMSEDLLLVETNNQRNNLAWFSGSLTPIGPRKPGKYLNFTCSYFYAGMAYRELVCLSVCMAKFPFCFHFLILVVDWITVKNYSFFTNCFFFFQKYRQHALKCIQNQKVRPVLLTFSSVWRVLNAANTLQDWLIIYTHSLFTLRREISTAKVVYLDFCLV